MARDTTQAAAVADTVRSDAARSGAVAELWQQSTDTRADSVCACVTGWAGESGNVEFRIPRRPSES